MCFEPTVVLSLFVAQITPSPILIGAPAAIKTAGLYLPQLPAALGVRHFQHIQGFFFWQAAIGRGALLGCAIGALMFDALGPALTLALVLTAWAAFSFTEGAATLAWLDLVGDVMDPRLRGRYFGLVQSVGGVLSLAAGLGVRAALGSDLQPTVFAGVFGWGFAGFALSVVCIGFVRERRDRERPALQDSSLSHVAKLIRGSHLIRLCSAQILASSLQLALPFYALFGRDALGLSGEWIGSYIVAQTLGTSLAALVWAPLAERYGARLIICLSMCLLVVIPLLPMLARDLPGVLLVAFLLAGASRGGTQAGFWQYILDLVPPGDRRVFMGLANTAIAPALLMPILGGAILQSAGYDGLFAASILLALAAIIAGLLLPKPLQIQDVAGAHL